MASELTAARQEMRKTNCKLEVVQHQMGDLQKQFTGMQDQLSRMETRLQRFVNSLRRTTEPAVGRGAPNLRPPGDPTDLLDRVQLAELEMEMTRRLEDLRQIVATGWEQDQLPNVSTPEGNFSFPSTGFSVVATGWDQDPSPHSSLASPTWNHQKPNQQVNFNPSNDMAPSFFKSLAKGPIIDSPEIVGGEPLVEAVAKKMESTMKSFTQGGCKYCGYKWVLGHRCKQNQQVNLMVGNFSAEAQFDLAKLYMGERVDKFILARSTGLRWNLPPWPGFCAMVSDCFAQPEDLALKVESAFYFVGALIISDSPATVMSSLLVVQKDLPIQHILPRRRIVVSRQGNHKVPVDVIYLTLRISQDDFPQYEEFKHNLIEVVTPEKLERDKGEPPPQSGLHKPSGLKLVAAHMRSNIELGSEPYDINEKYAILRALLMVLLNMVGRDGRVFRSMGLLWNLPPWPDLNDIKHYLKLLNPQSFCEVYSRAKDIEKGAAAICLRLVTSVPYLKGDTPSMLDEIVPKITEGFIASRIKSVQASFADNSSDNPLDNVEVLQEQLESLPYIGRFQYQSSSLYIINIMVPLLQAYTERSRLPAPGDADVLSVIEGQIAGMVHIIAAILKSRQTIGCSQESQELIDAELSARVLQLVNITDTGVHAQRYQELSKQRLDRAILIFVQNFRRSYVGDQAMHSAKLYARLYELLGLNDHLVLLNVIVGKIVTNLKCYAECEDVIDHTLSFFLELTSGYMTGKLLLKLESTKFIIANHSWENFPFLEEYRCFRSRTTFYYILGFLVFTEDGPVKFRSFMEPLLQVAVNREATADAASSVVKYAFIGLMKDLRDIAIAIYSRRTYGLLFDWMYPSRMPLLLRAILLWADEPEVTTPLLKFMYEFVLNKAQRLTFDPSSPNGILLFREISKLIVAYGSRILLLPNGTDIYGSKYKGIWISLTNLSRALCGNYVNFGVFELYGDRVLADALDISLKVTLSVPLSDIMAFCIESCSANWRVHSLFGPPSPVCSQFVWHIDRLNLVQFVWRVPSLKTLFEIIIFEDAHLSKEHFQSFILRLTNHGFHKNILEDKYAVEGKAMSKPAIWRN